MHLIASFGWTWEYIDDHMTIPRMTAVNKMQRERPPQYMVMDDLRRMVAGYMGVNLDAGKNEGQDSAPADGYASDGTTLFDMFR